MLVKFKKFWKDTELKESATFLIETHTTWDPTPKGSKGQRGTLKMEKILKPQTVSIPIPKSPAAIVLSKAAHKIYVKEMMNKMVTSTRLKKTNKILTMTLQVTLKKYLKP